MDTEDATSNKQTSKQETVTFYSKVKVLAIVSKIFSAFPLGNVSTNDGRKLNHSFLSLIYIFDIIAVIVFLYIFASQCRVLIDPDIEDRDVLGVWLSLTSYHVVFRGATQFLILHATAGRMPELFRALEEYYQGIGAQTMEVKPKKTGITGFCCKIFCCFLSIAWTILILFLVQMTSVVFFKQLNPDLTVAEVLPISTSYMFANIWKELPMNMFSKICLQLTERFVDIKKELKKLREKSSDKDIAKDLEKLRLQHSALLRIVTLYEKCYGFQLAVNIGFMVIEIVLQLFVFFIITKSKNVFLLGLAMYYLLMGFILLALVGRMERAVSVYFLRRNNNNK